MSPDPHKGGLILTGGTLLEEATGAVILLHGRGAAAADIMGLSHSLSAPGVAYLAPEAANRSWYPQSFLAPIEANEPYLTSALARVKFVVEMAKGAGVSVDKIVICGFSQGACLSTEFVLRFPDKYGGLIGFTGGLIGPMGMPLRRGGSLNGMLAFLGCGDPDPHVPWPRVAQSAEVLTSMGAKVLLKRYPGRTHTISDDELIQANTLINAVFK